MSILTASTDGLPYRALPDRTIPRVDDATRTHPVGGANTTPRPGITCLNTAPNGRTNRKHVSAETRKLPGPARERQKTSIAELLADRRCSQAVLDFLENTVVGRTPGPPVAEEVDEGASEASEWEERERDESLAEMRAEAERLGGEEQGSKWSVRTPSTGVQSRPVQGFGPSRPRNSQD